MSFIYFLQPLRFLFSIRSWNFIKSFVGHIFFENDFVIFLWDNQDDYNIWL